jgi:hypothetical protein
VPAEDCTEDAHGGHGKKQAAPACTQVAVVLAGLKHAAFEAAGDDSFYDFVNVLRFDAALLAPLPLLYRAAIEGQGLSHPVRAFDTKTDVMFSMSGLLFRNFVRVFSSIETWIPGNLIRGPAMCEGLGYEGRKPTCSARDGGWSVARWAQGAGARPAGQEWVDEKGANVLPEKAGPSKFIDLYRTLMTAVPGAFPEQECWAGRMFMQNRTKGRMGPHTLANTCSNGGEHGKKAKRKLDPRVWARTSHGGQECVMFYRSGDCQGLRLHPTNGSSGGVVDEFKEKVLAGIQSGLSCSNTHGPGCYTDEDMWDGKYTCTLIPGGCTCMMMIAGFGMDPRGCTC